MSLTNSRLAYKREFDLMDGALKEAKGARTRAGAHGDAMHLRMRMNKARTLDRKLNAKTYPETHILHGGSTYDELVFTIKQDDEDQWWVYMEKIAETQVVEPLE